MYLSLFVITLFIFISHHLSLSFSPPFPHQLSFPSPSSIPPVPLPLSPLLHFPLLLPLLLTRPAGHVDEITSCCFITERVPLCCAIQSVPAEVFDNLSTREICLYTGSLRQLSSARFSPWRSYFVTFFFFILFDLFIFTTFPSMFIRFRERVAYQLLVFGCRSLRAEMSGFPRFFLGFSKSFLSDI